MQESQPHRRSFLEFVTAGLGAIFSLIIGGPIVAYVLDPRNRKAPQSAMKLVEGVDVTDLGKEAPVQGVLRDTRIDGWTLYPNDVLGRVWVVRRKEKDLPASAADRKDLNKKTQAERDAFILVFTTICPHLGCSVNLGGAGFLCPCHSANFTMTGAKANDANPAKRDLDTLEWQFDEDDPEGKRIKVEYKRFKTLEKDKEPLA